MILTPLFAVTMIKQRSSMLTSSRSIRSLASIAQFVQWTSRECGASILVTQTKLTSLRGLAIKSTLIPLLVMKHSLSLHLTQTMPARSFNHARRYLSLLRLLCKVQLPSLISWASMESSKVTQSLGLNSQKTQMSHSVLQPTLAIHWHQQMETLVTIQKSVTVPAPLATQHAQLLQLMPLLASSMVSMEHSWV